ncbi:DUF3108 domain-containing protein [Rhizobium sp. BK251]|uniref:DUF3108 domain-containing protein n=1 Tax=Rhizobium sp. BK251 TaxID=2512125 RepID=UPI00104A2551|nr:DUF3108 domain-containing protein [Rhizobium sp. BK251]TCL72686.1 uncharacterized protein DUF3108 [Rhizobium sp. BK251]
MSQTGKRLLIATVATLVGLGAQAKEVQHETRYTVALAGLPIARAAFRTQIEDDKRYTIAGDINSAGLANLLTTLSAKTVVDGVIQRNKMQASRYWLYYKSGKRARTYEVQYRNGDVSSTTMKPDRKRPDSWIPVTKDDLRSVLDPISGLIFMTDARICQQTLPIYDGETRMDLVLSPKGSRPFSTDGFSGEALVCSVRFVPKSGYKKDRDDYEYLSKSNRMEIWFAKSDAANVYAPVYARIPTQYGPVTITAVKYGS